MRTWGRREPYRRQRGRQVAPGPRRGSGPGRVGPGLAALAARCCLLRLTEAEAGVPRVTLPRRGRTGGPAAIPRPQARGFGTRGRLRLSLRPGGRASCWSLRFLSREARTCEAAASERGVRAGLRYPLRNAGGGGGARAPGAAQPPPLRLRRRRSAAGLRGEAPAHPSGRERETGLTVVVIASARIL
ncbi:unnamed protein product [Coccothraustes coccothraustes]